jgi:hypothetical protein
MKANLGRLGSFTERAVTFNKTYSIKDFVSNEIQIGIYIVYTKKRLR